MKDNFFIRLLVLLFLCYATIQQAVSSSSVVNKLTIQDTIYSVTFKTQLPPSGDKHDYYSLAPYWWPDSTKENGLPYLRRDGQRNPEAKEITDKKMLEKMATEVISLAKEYRITSNKKYLNRANQLLRAWFLDSATRMNPNLNYAQAVKGRDVGRGFGLIETRIFIPLLGAVDVLRTDTLFEQQTYPELKQWFTEYLEWMEISENGKNERAAKNNHGTWYTAQYAYIAVFVGRKEVAVKELHTLKNRIAWQITPDGKQPLELERTKSLSYSIFNLEAYINAFTLADSLGLNLWNYQTLDGRSLQKAIEYVIPFIKEPSKWTYTQIIPMNKKDTEKALTMCDYFFTKIHEKNY